MKIHELGHVVLYVADLKRSSYFYREVLGFKELQRDEFTALYSSGRTHHELLLIEIGGKDNLEHVKSECLHRPRVGLYHIGFKIGNTDDELREALETCKREGVNIVGTANHHVTHSLYVLDPDGNELELYIDVDESWKEDTLKILKRVEGLKL